MGLELSEPRCRAARQRLGTAAVLCGDLVAGGDWVERCQGVDAVVLCEVGFLDGLEPFSHGIQLV